jgi:type IV pilus assembly protein PilB
VLFRSKSLAELDPSVSEVPQLGKLCFKVDELTVIASVSTFPTIMGERIFIKIYMPPKKLSDLINSEKQMQIINNAINESGIILVCGAPLSGKTHVIYSLLLEIASRHKNKNIMTLESFAKYNLDGVNQCELNENVNFNMDKASRFIEFQSPDIIYLEGVKTKEVFDYFSSLVYENKTILMEFLANNMEELRNKMAFSDFETLKSLISCMIFIHSQDSYEVFDRESLQKYLA